MSKYRLGRGETRFGSKINTNTIKDFRRQLKIAVHMLQVYGNIDLWSCVSGQYYNVFRCNPIKDGWVWAKEALEKIQDKKAPLTPGERQTKI